jgi:hypothetical protein
MHVQERIAEREAAQPGGSWRKSYYMPTESDRCAPGCCLAVFGTASLLCGTLLHR